MDPLGVADGGPVGTEPGGCAPRAPDGLPPSRRRRFVRRGCPLALAAVVAFHGYALVVVRSRIEAGATPRVPGIAVLSAGTPGLAVLAARSGSAAASLPGALPGG